MHNKSNNFEFTVHCHFPSSSITILLSFYNFSVCVCVYMHENVCVNVGEKKGDEDITRLIDEAIGGVTNNITAFALWFAFAI